MPYDEVRGKKVSSLRWDEFFCTILKKFFRCSRWESKRWEKLKISIKPFREFSINYQLMSIKSYQLHNLARFFQLFLSFISFIVLIFHIQKNASEKLNTEEEKIKWDFNEFSWERKTSLLCGSFHNEASERAQLESFIMKFHLNNWK